ncbi:hypothetical protein DFH06DRAFT_113680 [Mycena polygramma]|nr:hypothetical protein DFH06DRAFT_113680 [Mycena polygramma]
MQSPIHGPQAAQTAIATAAKSRSFAGISWTLSPLPGGFWTPERIANQREFQDRGAAAVRHLLFDQLRVLVPASEEEWTVLATALTSLATLKALLATTDGHIEGCTFCPIHSPEPIGGIITEFHVYVGAFVSLSEEHGVLRLKPWFIRHFGYLAQVGLKAIRPQQITEPQEPRKNLPEKSKKLAVLLDRANIPLDPSSSAPVPAAPSSRKTRHKDPLGKPPRVKSVTRSSRPAAAPSASSSRLAASHPATPHPAASSLRPDVSSSEMLPRGV